MRCKPLRLIILRTKKYGNIPRRILPLVIYAIIPVQFLFIYLQPDAPLPREVSPADGLQPDDLVLESGVALLLQVRQDAAAEEQLKESRKEERLARENSHGTLPKPKIMGTELYKVMTRRGMHSCNESELQ